MGIENRDYTREGDYTGTLAGWGLDDISPVVKWLIAANVIVFLLQIFLTRETTPADIQQRWDQLPPPMQRLYREADEQQALYEQSIRRSPAANEAAENEAAPQTPEVAADKTNVPPESFAQGESYQRVCLVNEWLELKTSLVLRGQVWRLVTAAFLHDRGGVFHILFNMLALFWFGVTLESMYGGREFLIFYLAGAVAASLAHVGLDLYLGSNVPAVGASGAVMAVLMVYAIHYPRTRSSLGRAALHSVRPAPRLALPERGSELSRRRGPRGAPGRPGLWVRLLAAGPEPGAISRPAAARGPWRRRPRPRPHRQPPPLAPAATGR
jgi:membrane associated rhomboid family serine protease